MFITFPNYNEWIIVPFFLITGCKISRTWSVDFWLSIQHCVSRHQNEYYLVEPGAAGPTQPGRVCAEIHIWWSVCVCGLDLIQLSEMSFQTLFLPRSFAPPPRLILRHWVSGLSVRLAAFNSSHRSLIQHDSLPLWSFPCHRPFGALRVFLWVLN